MTTKQSAGQTMIDLVNAAEARSEAQRIAKIKAAKTNFEYLFAAGVITTCDDEFDRAQRWSYAERLAAEAKVPVPTMLAAMDFGLRAESIVAGLVRIVENGETDEEFSARLQAAVEASPHPVAEGMKRPCQHNGTKKARGLFMRDHGYAKPGEPGRDAEYVCCRCGTEVKLPRRPPVITHAAMEAARLLALVAPDRAERKARQDAEWRKRGL